MKSANKAILFLKVTRGTKTEHPVVAVFNDKDAASKYAGYLQKAVGDANVAEVKRLFPGYPFDGDGKLAPSNKLQLTIAAYSPDPAPAVDAVDLEEI